ncbi:MAG: helix-turn-helix transcriptional regulator [Lachnospiraceae bacterium]|nr:helix-turn-helix transcriptional regulator [Lachnospiraceae bacterium]
MARGLYSATMMCRVEAGERLPDYLMRNRLMSRLGISAEGFEDYIQPDEYERYLQLREIMDLVEHERIDLASGCIKAMLSTCNKREKIEYQFLLDMQGRLVALKGGNVNEVIDIYNTAIQVTIPDYNYQELDHYLLAPEEYYLLIQRLEYVKFDNQWLEEIEAMIQTLSFREMQSVSKSKIFAKGAFLYGKMILKHKASDKTYVQRALQYVVRAVEMIRDSKRLYYAIELLDLFDKLCEELHEKYPDNDTYDEYQHFKSACIYMYGKYPIDVSIENDCYVYKAADVRCIGDVIASRRNMLGMTKRELADDLCSVRTLIRIERKQGAVQQDILNQILNRLYISPGYRRAELLTSNVKLIKDYKRCRMLVNNGEKAELETLMAQIHEEIDYSVVQNRQVMLRIRNKSLLDDNTITREEFVQRLWKTLSLSGVNTKNAFKSKNYLTKVEKACLYNLALKGSYKEEFINYYEEYINNNENMDDIPFIELVNTWMASEIGDQGNYGLSSAIAKKTILLLLKNRRGTEIAANAYGVCWNEAMSNSDNKNSIYEEELYNIYWFSVFIRDKSRAHFLLAQMEKLKKGADWTK